MYGDHESGPELNCLVYASTSDALFGKSLGAGTPTTGHCSLQNTSQNWLILDLGLLFASNMLAFSLWYQLADAYLKGGAFDFPPNGAHPEDPPRWIDYLFLSFNTQSTFGPTLEGIRTRPVKVMMMLQTALSVILLVVLVARIIVAPS